MEAEIICNTGAVTAWLHRLRPFFQQSEKHNVEVSWRLRPGVLQKWGRVSCWTEGSLAGAFPFIAAALDALQAPAIVKQAQAASQNPYLQGLGFSLAGGGSYRLYLHSRHPETFNDQYEAWQWTGDGKAGRFRYTFHFFTPHHSEAALERQAPGWLLTLLQEMVTDSRFRQLSGYWLRYNEADIIDQIDLAFPWCPAAGTLPGFARLCTLLQVDAASVEALALFPLRHIAFKTTSATPEVTLYTSAFLDGEWPQNEEALQSWIMATATAYQAELERDLFASLPQLPAEANENSIGEFYDGSIDTWKEILGPGMHYHAGLFNGDGTTDEEAEQAFVDAVKSLYPFLPFGGRIYDIGCGWGGPLRMITRDLRCSVLGLTPSLTQFNYLSSLGYAVRLGNAAHTLPPGPFDCVLMIESLCHVANKERLLTILKQFTSRLVIRLNCQDQSPPSEAFGGSMHLISSGEFYSMLLRTGWQVKHWKNVRCEGLPSVAVWNRRLQRLPPTTDRHIETLREWSAVVCTNAEAWGANNPLIEVVADLG